MQINHNIAALNTYNKLNANQNATSKSLEKLSSGLKINKAGDDAAGLAISEKMRGQIRGLDQASANASDGISLIKTAEGGLNETHSILQRMRELAVQSANDTNTDDDRVEIQKEVGQLSAEITRIGNDTAFNTKSLLNGDADGVSSGSSGASITIQVGANEDQSITLDIKDMRSDALGLSGVDVSTQSGANIAITTINDAITSVSSERATLGSKQNRLEHTINNLGASSENATAAESRIRDVDMAKEMMEFTKNNILTQAAQSMMAQANQQPQSVLKLLQ